MKKGSRYLLTLVILTPPDVKDYFSTLNRILNAYSHVDREGVEYVLESGTIESRRKNEVIFYEKRFNGFEYFQFEGVSHRFNTNEEKQLVTTGIYQNQIVITPHFARTPNGQSIFSLQALTDCVFLIVPAGRFRELLDNHQQIKMFGRAVVEREYIMNLRFEVLFRSYSAKDRLLFFREHYPNLENLIPHTVIASFLGITPVSFSRLRNELARP